MNILTSLSVLGSLTYPSKLSKTLNLEGSDTLKLTLQIKDKATQAGIQHQQAFLLLTNEDTDVDSVQVLEVANSGRGKLELVSVISHVEAARCLRPSPRHPSWKFKFEVQVRSSSSKFEVQSSKFKFEVQVRSLSSKFKFEVEV